MAACDTAAWQAAVRCKETRRVLDANAVSRAWDGADDDHDADTSGGGLSSGINADPSHRPKTPLVVLYSCELEVTKQKVLQAGGSISRDIFSFPGGRRFHYVDPAGNELAVWSGK